MRLAAYLTFSLCVGVIIAHGVVPDDFQADETTVALVVIALIALLLPQLPTLARYMTRLRLPGVEAQFREQADKAAASLDALRVSRGEPGREAATGDRATRFALDRALYEGDPNLRVTRLAIELERTLREFARAKEIDVERQSLSQAARLLEKREALSREQGRVLRDIEQLRNQAVHGATLTASDALTFENLVEKFLLLLD